MIGRTNHIFVAVALVFLYASCATRHTVMDVASGHAVDSVAAVSQTIVENHKSETVVDSTAETTVTRDTVRQQASTMLTQTVTEDIVTTTDTLGRVTRHEQRTTVTTANILQDYMRSLYTEAERKTAERAQREADSLWLAAVSELWMHREDSSSAHKETSAAVNASQSSQSSLWQRVKNGIADIIIIVIIAVFFIALLPRLRQLAKKYCEKMNL